MRMRGHQVQPAPVVLVQALLAPALSAVALSAVALPAVGLSAVALSAVGLSAVALSAVALPAVALSAVALSAVALSAVALSAVAQEDAGDRWARRNDRGNRYEGRREIPVSRPDFELISFLGHQEDYEVDVELRVGFFVPEAGGATIYAQELRDEKQYWMESKPGDWQVGGWNEFGPWPTREVLDEEQIAAWDFGLYVEVEAAAGSQDAIHLAPAVLYHSEVPDRLEVYTLCLRPNWDLKRLEVSVSPADGGGGEVILRDRVLHQMPVGEPIQLDLDAAGLPDATWLRLEAVGGIRGRIDEAVFEMFFFHKADTAGI